MLFSSRRSDPQYIEGVEARPELDRHLQCSVEGLHIAGAATGSPLLKTSINEGVEVVRHISRLMGPSSPSGDADVVDLVIIGAGPAGLAAAVEASSRGYTYRLLEMSRPFNTISNFPAGKRVYAEPAGVATLGDLWLGDSVKEELLERWGDALERVRVERGAEVKRIKRKDGLLEVTTARGEVLHARRGVLAIGRMGNPRQLGVPGLEWRSSGRGSWRWRPARDPRPSGRTPPSC